MIKNEVSPPPPEGTKNEIFKFRSVNNIVIAPARTGRDKSSRIVAIIRIDQTKRGILSRDIDFRKWLGQLKAHCGIFGM